MHQYFAMIKLLSLSILKQICICILCQIDSKYAKGYKSRGAAYSMLAKWEEAAQDLQSASELDFDEETNACLT